MTSCRPCDQASSTGPWKHGRVPVIGLIGGIGSGKSAVAAIAGGAGRGCDRCRRSGPRALDRSGGPRSDRRRFGRFRPGRGRFRLVRRPANRQGRSGCDRVRRSGDAARAGGDCSSPDARPVSTGDRAVDAARRRRGLIVLDAAILLEAGWDDLCDRVVFVDAPRSLRLAARRRPARLVRSRLRISRSGPVAMRREAPPCGYRPGQRLGNGQLEPGSRIGSTACSVQFIESNRPILRGCGSVRWSSCRPRSFL